MSPNACEITTERLVDYYLGELPQAQRAEVATHLASCGACAVQACQLYADLDGMGEALTESPAPHVRRELRGKVRREFTESFASRLRRFFALPVPAYQAALMVACVAALLVVLPARTSIQVQLPVPTEPASAEHVQTMPAPEASRTLLQGYDASTVLTLDPAVF